jgi:L-alanine-DL-glutamate epimerase-like enolase superfamily enzyme
MPVMQGGDFLIPDRPGHGMTLSPGARQKYRVA